MKIFLKIFLLIFLFVYPRKTWTMEGFEAIPGLEEMLTSCSRETLQDPESKYMRTEDGRRTSEYNQGRTALHDAIRNRDYDLMNRLLRTNESISDHDSYGETPFMYLEHIFTNRHINEKNEEGRTILHYAVIFGEVSRVSELLEAGASMKIRDRYNKTAKDYAKETRYNSEKIINAMHHNPNPSLSSVCFTCCVVCCPCLILLYYRLRPFLQRCRFPF